MEYIITILAITIISAITYFSIIHKHKATSDNGSNKKAKATKKTTATKPMPDFTGMKTRELCIALLNELNCEVVEDEDDNERLEFNFQGETFHLIASDDCLMVTVYNFSWGSVDLDDIDEVSRLRKVINSVNFRFGGLSVIYTIDTDHNKMVVHTKRQFLMTPEIPNIVNYVTAMLTGFFEVQRALTHELDRLRLEKEAEQKGS